MNDLINKPTPRQANRTYLLLLILLFVGSMLLQKRLGIGGNLWVNELAYLLLPPLILAFRHKWPLRETYRMKAAPFRLLAVSMLVGVTYWLFNAVLYNALEYLTGLLMNPLSSSGAESVDLPALQIIFTILGMVVLAPVCEETFFRGFMLRAYEDYGIKQSWIIAGVLFGAMHVMNGMSNLIPAILLGLIFGFLATRTGSIWPAVAMHCGNNLMSLFGAAILPAVVTPQILPLWIYGLAILSALITLLFLLTIGGRTFREPDAITPEPEGSSAIKSLRRSKPLWLAVIFLLLIAGVEIEMRVNQKDSLIIKWSKTAASDLTPSDSNQETNIRACEFTGGFLLFSIDVQPKEVGKELIFRFDYKVAEINEGTFKLLDPNGAVVWEDGIQGIGLTAQNEVRQAALDQPGQWQLYLQGSGRELEIRAVWKIE